MLDCIVGTGNIYPNSLLRLDDSSDSNGSAKTPIALKATTSSSGRRLSKQQTERMGRLLAGLRLGIQSQETTKGDEVTSCNEGEQRIWDFLDEEGVFITDPLQKQFDFYQRQKTTFISSCSNLSCVEDNLTTTPSIAAIHPSSSHIFSPPMIKSSISARRATTTNIPSLMTTSKTTPTTMQLDAIATEVDVTATAISNDEKPKRKSSLAVHFISNNNNNNNNKFHQSTLTKFDFLEIDDDDTINRNSKESSISSDEDEEEMDNDSNDDVCYDEPLFLGCTSQSSAVKSRSNSKSFQRKGSWATTASGISTGTTFTSSLQLESSSLLKKRRPTLLGLQQAPHSLSQIEDTF